MTKTSQPKNRNENCFFTYLYINFKKDTISKD